MNGTGLLVKNVPFPYFILDRNLKVLEKSNQAHHIFQHSAYFSELIENQYQHEMNCFLLTSSTIDHIEIPMNKRGSKVQFFQIYKSVDESSNIHIYCFPLKNEFADVNELFNLLEKKLFKFNQNLLEKKEYLERTVKRLKGTAKTFDQQSNVGKLAAGIAHEIRNPLTTVKGFLQLIKPYLKEIGKDQYAEVALDEINRANDIIYEFLNATKPQTIPFYGISVNKVVKDIVMLFESEAILRDIQMVTAFSNNDAEITFDSNQLKQILSNLLKNAIEAIDENYSLERTIQISTVIDSEIVSIHISDSGCGMTDETKKNLFTPFFTTKEKGTGIGLNMCKKIIEDNGGTIGIESTKGKGTTFTICFPVKVTDFSSFKKNA